jgi:protein Mpv17
MLLNALRAGVQSGSIMSVADVATQLFVEGKSLSNDYDLTRTLRWTVAGLTLHGPYFFVGFSMVDKRFGAVTTLKAVAKKTAVAQFILFPPYLVALFGLMGVLEKHPNTPDKIKQRVPEAFLSGCLYWPIANGINFAMVPPTMRVPYLAASAGVWNSYLSWANARDVSKKNEKITT